MTRSSPFNSLLKQLFYDSKNMAFLDKIQAFFSGNWFSFSLTVGILILLYLLWSYVAYRSALRARDLPGPTPLPFIGHLLDFMMHKGQSYLQFDEYYKRYGRNFSMFLFGKTPTLIINDPEMVKEVLVKQFQSFRDRPIIAKLGKPLDSMMPNAVGETWHRIRTTLSPTFSAHKMKLMIPLMNKSCDLLEKKLDHVAGTGETIDIHKYHQSLTMDAILATFFGIESNAQNDYDDPAFKTARESFKMGTLRLFIVILLFVLPGGSIIMKLFPRVVIGQYLGMIALTEKIIKAKRKKDDKYTKDALDIMLSNTENKDLPENKRLTEEEVIAQSLIFLFAGYETTSTTLAFVCHNLATSPDVQEKLQKEIDEVWIDEDQSPSYEVVQSLPYLDMVISETLRLYPPVFFLTRVCTKDCSIKGLTIKKGKEIHILTYSIHRDPEFFQDPDKFDPERFSAEAKASRDPYTYLPFGHGPRNCIGMRFAQMEMKLALVRILKRFTLVVAPETKIPPEVTAQNTLLCKDGIKLRVECRI